MIDGIDWMLDANCRGANSDLFFPVRGEDTRPAMMICAGCTVKVDCLEWALTHHERQGVWGGTSDRQRRRMVSARVKIHGPERAVR